VFRLIHLHPTVRLARVFFARWHLRMMDLAVAVHMKGFNAVNDALRGLGVEFNETPLAPHKIVAALAETEARKPNSAAT
jgi:hypothetical protein